MKSELQSALCDIVSELESNGIRYCLVGGLAQRFLQTLEVLSFLFFLQNHRVDR